MSIDSVMSRVSQLQAMLAGVTPQPAAPTPATTSSTAFASALQDAAAAGDSSTDSSTTGSTSGLSPLLASTTAIGATPATASTLPASVPYRNEITAAAQANGIDPALLAGLIKQESDFNPNAGSGAGARGLTQLMPGTAQGLGVTNLSDPVQQINAGAKYLKEQLDTFGGDVTKALAAYNAGPGAVQRFGGVPPYSETQNYVRVVQANAASYRTSTT
jgi:soluble lytic murein transglycosylase-like protein